MEDKIKDLLPFSIGTLVRNKDDGTLYKTVGYVINEDYSLSVSLIDMEYPNFTEDDYDPNDFEIVK